MPGIAMPTKISILESLAFNFTFHMLYGMCYITFDFCIHAYISYNMTR